MFNDVFTVLCSIDNDMLSNYSLGFFTAVQQAYEFIKSLELTNRAMRRNAVYEVMGNKKGFIAVLIDFATYSNYLLIDEIFEDEFKMGKKHK